MQEIIEQEGMRSIRDDRGAVQELVHFGRPFVARAQLPQLAAREYLESYGRYYDIRPEELGNLGAEPEPEPVDAGVEYRFLEQKTQFDMTTVGYQQTYLGLPVWRAGLSVQIKDTPSRVVSSQSTAHKEIDARKPRREALRKFARLDPKALAALLGLERGTEQRLPRILQQRLVVFLYAAERRISDERHSPNGPNGANGGSTGLRHDHPTLPLPPVPDSILDGHHYVAAEITFVLPQPSGREVTWVALVEVETGAVLYLRAFVDNVDGLLFVSDPITATGNLANSPAATNATLNPLRSSVPLLGLTPPPFGSDQALTGNFIRVNDFEPATVAPPTRPVGFNFSYVARTNNFAAVSAYYHCDRFFRLVEDLGFAIGTYFNGTTFPLPVDHRGRYGSLDGIELNASCSGNGMGGIANVDFELADLTDTGNPMGLAADWRVVLHELGGHGILYDHVNSPNFGFAHSAGDSFAAILNDPETQAPDRFETYPWVSVIGRRHDRSVAAGWGWGGSNDSGGYNSEQILCTTSFRIYRSLGGDSPHVNTRRFAARYMAYLLLRAVGTLTPATNPGNASGFANALMTADQGDWTSEGHAGGAYGKVIRWAFEKQGLYQPAGAPTPVTTAGAPPPVDVYIDDGRHGEYQFQPNHWSCQSIWNRLAADGGAAHQEPITGQTNYAYVKIKNRGTQTATNVVVKGFHCIPSSGLVWPSDWQPMTTPQLAAPNVAPNNSAEITVGPFEWTPSQPHHECMLMIVAATGDPSNIDNFTAGDSIPEWRLVPHDNNIGQRNVAPVPGGGGIKGLLTAFDRRPFRVLNPHRTRARMTLEAKLPPLLAERGWEMSFVSAGGGSFSLEPGQSKEILLSLRPGREISAADVKAARPEDRVIHVEAQADGIVIGGLSYQLDPDLTEARGGGKPKPDGDRCEAAKDLLQCLCLPAGDVKSVRVRRISLEIELDDKGC